MSTVWLAAAASAWIAHLALIVVLIVGAPIALRWRPMLRIHVPAMVATSAVFLLGADCPLTVLQQRCLERAGRTPYQGGFIEHYLVEPLTGGGMTPIISGVILASWLLPTVMAYGTLVRRDASAEAPPTS